MHISDQAHQAKKTALNSSSGSLQRRNRATSSLWWPCEAMSVHIDVLKLTRFAQGGGLIFASGPEDDFSDWVAHDQRFITVNMNYRLGPLGFLNHPDLPSANAGLLDQRMSM